MVRQPYSVAVKSDEEERFPLLPWGEKTEMRGGAFFNGKEGRDDFRKLSFWLKGDGGIWKTPSLMVKKDGMILELLIIRTKINTMNIVKTEIEGVLIIEPRLFRDSRGYFFESFSEREFEEKATISDE